LGEKKFEEKEKGVKEKGEKRNSLRKLRQVKYKPGL
jgi:hypothetical protein